MDVMTALHTLTTVCGETEYSTWRHRVYMRQSVDLDGLCKWRESAPHGEMLYIRVRDDGVSLTYEDGTEITFDGKQAHGCTYVQFIRILECIVEYGDWS
jgi:hypothetical protein